MKLKDISRHKLTYPTRILKIFKEKCLLNKDGLSFLQRRVEEIFDLILTNKREISG